MFFLFLVVYRSTFKVVLTIFRISFYKKPFQPVPFLPHHFNCPVITPFDCTHYIEINFLSFKCHFWNFGMTLLYAMTCFGLFTKIEKGVWYQFLCTCSAWFFNKSISYLIFYQSKSYLFSFSRYQTNCFMKFLFRQLVTS